MRAVSVRVLLVVTAILLVAATVTSYAWLALFDADRFVDRATAALQDPSVRTVIADRVTDDLVLRQEPDLLAARPLVASRSVGRDRGRRVREPVPARRARRPSRRLQRATGTRSR